MAISSSLSRQICGAALICVVELAMSGGCQGTNDAPGVASPNRSATPVAVADLSPERQAIPGFALALAEDTYWEYRWHYERTAASSSGADTESATGGFRVTLGQPTSIGGLTAYPLAVQGETQDPGHDYAPRWRFLAADQGRLLGSSDGRTLEVIFDPQAGHWSGGGFFTTFPANGELKVAAGQADNEFVQTGTVRVTRAAGQSFCETIAGVQVCPNDTSLELWEVEHYKSGIGPIAYDFLLGQSSTGGGFNTTIATERSLGLVATSLNATDGFLPKPIPWRECADMPTARTGASSAVLDGKIYVLGGRTLGSANRILPTVEIYDPAKDTWSAGTPMPEPRYGHISVMINGRIYVVGGWSEEGATSDVWVYDPTVKRWTAGSEPSAKMAGHAAVAADRFVLVFPVDRRNVFAYDTANDAWLEAAPMENVFPGSDFSDRTAALAGNEIYLIGGLFYGKFRDENWRLDLSKPQAAQDAWSHARSMPTVRARLTSAVVNDQVYVIGGFNFKGAERTVEAFDPRADSWTPKYAMLTPRESPTSAVVSGEIYVIGGQDGNRALATVEAYNPTLDR